MELKEIFNKIDSKVSDKYSLSAYYDNNIKTKENIYITEIETIKQSLYNNPAYDKETRECILPKPNQFSIKPQYSCQNNEEKVKYATEICDKYESADEICNISEIMLLEKLLNKSCKATINHIIRDTSIIIGIASPEHRSLLLKYGIKLLCEKTEEKINEKAEENIDNKTAKEIIKFLTGKVVDKCDEEARKLCHKKAIEICQERNKEYRKEIINLTNKAHQLQEECKINKTKIYQLIQ